MRLYISIILYLLAGFCQIIFAQQVVTVNQVELKSYPDVPTSYIVNTTSKLVAPFNFKPSTATPTFFLRGNTQASTLPTDKNFVRVETMLGTATNNYDASNLVITKKTTVYEYFDGLGRSVQKVNVKGSSSAQNDIISYSSYDEFGRQPKQFLPYTCESGNGAFRPGAASEQTAFYQTPPSGVAGDTEPFSVSDFTNPLVKSYGVGADWHTAAKNKFSQTVNMVNVANEVLQWTYTGTGFPTTSGSYAANLLAVTQTTDEGGLIKKTYKNFKGQVILDRSGDGNPVWHDTYYIYDYYGNVAFIISPEAISRLGEYAAGQQAFLDRWAYQYQYDSYQRTTGVKVPGADWVYMIYDKWDRLVLTQDGNLRLTNKWLFTKYDLFNRPIITGFTTGTQSTLQTAINAVTVRNEDRLVSSIGYTNKAFPTHVEADLLTITYYDDYNFKGYSDWSTNFNFVTESGFPLATDLISTTTVKGHATGSKVKNLSTGNWLKTVTYYDKKYNVVQVIGDNHLAGIDRVTNSNDFAGRLLKSLYVHTSSTTSSLSVLKELIYDHGSRLLFTYHTINGGTRVLLASNKYNELGQLIEKNIHSTDGGITFLQSLDYRYNIRGWVTQINNSTLSNDGVTNNDANDLFGMDIIYNQEQVNVNGTNSTPLYNGNISAIRWSKNNLKDATAQNIYSYKYDTWNRLSTSSFAQKATTWNLFADGSNENLTYDNNGNIATLKRNAIFYIGPNPTVVTIDDLAYRYELKTSLGDASDISYSNKLLNVFDNSAYYANDNPDNGFTEFGRAKTITEYTYDNNGNVTYDANKNITQILYNHLNLPTYIEFYADGASTRQTIEYTYDAGGKKLKKVDKVGGTVISTTDYVGGLQYENGQLAFILHDEGRAVNNAGTYNYEYFLRDPQGSTRVVYGYQKEVDIYKATLEPERDNVERIEKNQKGFYNITRTTGYNHTSKNYETPNPKYATMLDGAVGPGKTLLVKQGDKISLEVFARYTGTVSNSKLTSTALASAVTTVFFPGGPGETPIAYNGLNSAVLSSTVNGNVNAPVAYLFYLIFSPDYSWYQFGVHAISSEASIGFQWLHLEVPINFPASVTAQQGYIYTYVANETTGTPVYFDDFQIIHEKATSALQVTQTSDYYPFGLANSFLSYQKQAPSISLNKNKYNFQGQELQNDFGLNWYQYKFRIHDPSIGRFVGVDPLAEKYTYNSVYAFSENRVVDGIELEGAEILFFNPSTMERAQTYSSYIDDNAYRWDGGVLTGLVNWGYDLAYDKVSSWADAFRGGVNFAKESNNFENSRDVYSSEIGMDEESKSTLYFTKQAKNITQTINGANAIMGDALAAMTTVMTMESSGISLIQGLTRAPVEVASTGRTFVFGSDRATLNNAGNLIQRGEWDNVIVHGTSDGFKVNGNKIAPKDFASMMYERGYKAGTPVRLVSCWTGLYEDGAAYELSQHLKAPILAPTNEVGITSQGSFLINGGGNWQYFKH